MGLKVEIRNTDQATYLKKVQDPKHDWGGVRFGRWSCSCLDADGVIYPLFHTGEIWSSYQNPAFDGLVEQARQVTDKRQRTSLYHQVFQVLARDLPGLGLFQDYAIYGANSRVRWIPDAQESFYLDDDEGALTMTTTTVIPRRRSLAALPATPRYVAGRVGQALLALFGVVTIVFFALRLSGDPARLLVPTGASAADMRRVRDRLGLSDSLWHQYVSFLGHAVHGDLGYSYVQNRPATDLLAERIPYTANLAVAALVLSLLFGVTVGVVDRAAPGPLAGTRC